MAARLYLTRSGNGATITLYGALTTIPTALKQSGIKLTGQIQMATGNSAPGWVTTCTCNLFMKISGGTQTIVKQTAKTGNAGSATTASATFDTTIDLSSATSLAFMFTANGSKDRVSSQGPSTFSPSYSGFFAVYLELPSNITSETTITAAKVNEIATFIGSSASATAGNKITVSPYSTLATAIGAAAFNTTSPLSSDLTSLLSTLNSANITRSWDSTSSSAW